MGVPDGRGLPLGGHHTPALVAHDRRHDSQAETGQHVQRWLGLGRIDAVQGDETGGLAFRRHPQPDGDRLAQVVTNLVGNALHHGVPGQPVHLTVDGTQAHTVKITVDNQGTIPPALLPQIFAPFSGREREPGRHQGLGLGLFIVSQIVRVHGGRIDVTSAQGTTSFRVELPRESKAPVQTASVARKSAV